MCNKKCFDVLRYGRKLPMMFAIVLLLVAGVGTSLAPWYELFLPLRFATALAIGGLMISSFVLSEYQAYNLFIGIRI